MLVVGESSVCACVQVGFMHARICVSRSRVCALACHSAGRLTDVYLHLSSSWMRVVCAQVPEYALRTQHISMSEFVT